MKAVVIGEPSGANMEAIMKVYPRHKVIVDKYIARNEVIGIGPFADMGNMAIFRSRSAAEQFVTEDPFILEGLVKSYVIRDWNDSLLPESATGKSFTATIEIPKPPAEVFHALTQGVPNWWGGKDYSGSSSKLNDVFIVNHPGAHYSKQKLAELVKDEKIVWHVEESKLDWLKVQDEWTNTRMIFEIIHTGYSSILLFTHEGLVPEKESYARCSEGWGLVIKEWLFDFIVNGKAHFEL
jgi:uncharacterized protein YciI/uncharacterized protein YndB with AHSA1/START domain